MSKCFIYSERAHTLHVTSSTPGQAQQLFPGGGPVLMSNLEIIAGLENDGIILVGSSDVCALGAAGGSGYVDQLSPGDQRIYSCKENEVYIDADGRPQRSIPEFIDASSIWVLLDNSNTFFGAGLNCYLSIVTGARIEGFYR